MDLYSLSAKPFYTYIHGAMSVIQGVGFQNKIKN